MQVINKRIIYKERVVQCDIDTLWWKWTSEEGVKSFINKENCIDLRINGPYEIYFIPENPPGLRGGEGNKILSYLPKKMLSFSWNAPPEYPGIRNHKHKTWVVLDFERINATQTNLQLKHIGWLDGPDWDEVYQYFEQAWELVLDWLEASCESVK